MVRLLQLRWNISTELYRIQCWEYHLPRLFSSSWSTLTTRVEKDGAWSLDSDPNGSLEHCCYVTARVDWQTKLLHHSCTAENARSQFSDNIQDLNWCWLSQGGFIPDIVLWLSYFYTGRELPIRLRWFWISSLKQKHINNVLHSYFWTTLSATAIVTSLLAFAIFHLKGVAGWAAWR
jgi:hypothetical protein